MKRIAILVDFSSICAKALEFGASIAAKAQADVVLVHVTEATDEQTLKALEEKLSGMHVAIAGKVLNSKNHVASGSFFSVIPSVIADLKVDLVVVPTHGKVGIAQHLLGSNILKLVKTLPVPALVVQAESVLNDATFKTLLFPVGPNKHFDVKYKQTAKFAKIYGSTVVVYTVRNDIRGISDELRANITDSMAYFESVGVKCEEVAEEPTSFSAGYAKHILHYAKTSGAGTICIMSLVADDQGYIGNNDKENILLNTMALPVFCANL